jgi:hypothetical protein
MPGGPTAKTAGPDISTPILQASARQGNQLRYRTLVAGLRFPAGKNLLG